MSKNYKVREQKGARSEMTKQLILSKKGGFHKNSADKRVNKKDQIDMSECNLRSCYNCSDVAVWFYGPDLEDKDSSYYCEFHVPRGCSCVKEEYNDLNSTSQEMEKDPETGMILVCLDYLFNAEGFEKLK